MKHSILFLLFILLSSSNFGQDNSPVLSPKIWKQEMKNVDYTKHIKKPEKKKKEAKKQNQAPPTYQPEKKQNAGKTVQTVAYVIAIILVVIILALILHRFRMPTKISSSTRLEATSLEEAEENLPTLALNNIFQEALDKKDFKTALRIRFLMILQELIDQKRILWKKSKTNENYRSEITDSVVQSNFSQLVAVYDDAWYGEKEITLPLFDTTMVQIDSIHQLIHPNEE